MKKRLIPIILAVLLPGITVAQSVDEVRNNPDYLYGEGFGRSLREADNDALQNLISKIKCEKIAIGKITVNTYWM